MFLLVNRVAKRFEHVLVSVSLRFGFAVLQNASIDIRSVSIFLILKTLDYHKKMYILFSIVHEPFSSTYVSVLTIIAFSVERYLAVCHPLHLYTMSGFRRASRIIFMLWVVSIISALPFFSYTNISYVYYPPGEKSGEYWHIPIIRFLITR